MMRQAEIMKPLQRFQNTLAKLIRLIRFIMMSNYARNDKECQSKVLRLCKQFGKR